MFSERNLINHLEEISENAKILKLSFVSSEKFTVLLKCKVEEDQNKSYYDSFVLQWIRKFSTFTATTWIVRNSFPKLKRLLYRKVFTCHRSAFNKKKLTSLMTRNQECRAKIDFKMKFINRNTIKNDPCLKEGLNMTIAIEFVHTHKVRTPEAINMLKSTAETDDVFYNYFSIGYSPSAAKMYHELVIADRYGDSAEYMMNSNINPTLRHILYLHGKAKSNKWDNQSFEELMEPRKVSLVTADGFISYELPEVVIVITPIMKRTISAFSLDHILVDGTATSSGQSVTFLYVPSKAGALPIACILHTEKSEACYSQAFLETKLALEKISGRNIEPKILTIKEWKEMREAADVICSNSKVVSSKWSLCSEVWRFICSDDIKIESRKRHGLMQLFNRLIRSQTTEEGEKYYDQLKCEACVTSCQLLVDRVEQLWQTRDQWMMEYESPCMNLVEASIRITNEFIRRRCKTFNVHTMVDVVTNIMETKLRQILIAHAKNKNVASAYTRLSTTSKEVFDASMRRIVGSKEFRVEINAYKKTKIVKFRIDTWCCDCLVGKSGRFCEHLSAVINFQETDLMKTTELTDEEKCLFSEIAGGDIEDENKMVKSEIVDDNYGIFETSDNDDDDKIEMADDTAEDERPVSPPLDSDDNYFYLEVKTEHLDTNDPLDENIDGATISQPMNVDTREEVYGETGLDKIAERVDALDASKIELKTQYESAMRMLNNEFRRLNKYFKENPNRSNMETMARLARELSKIRPIERVNFTDMHVTLNNDTLH